MSLKSKIVYEKIRIIVTKTVIVLVKSFFIKKLANYQEQISFKNKCLIASRDANIVAQEVINLLGQNTKNLDQVKEIMVYVQTIIDNATKNEAKKQAAKHLHDKNSKTVSAHVKTGQVCTIPNLKKPNQNSKMSNQNYDAQMHYSGGECYGQQ